MLDEVISVVDRVQGTPRRRQNGYCLAPSQIACKSGVKVMAQTGDHRNLQRTVNMAGWFYFLIILSSLASLAFLGGKYTVMGDGQATVLKMAQQAWLVRINIVYEVFMFSAVIVLAVCLYEILKPVDQVLARVAMLFRVGEAILGYLTVFCTLAVLLLVKGQLEANRVDPLAITFYDLRDIAYLLLMVCISLGTIIFFWLFYKARYLPRAVSLWGVIGFSIMLLASILRLLEIEAGNTVNAVAAAIVIPFELFVGLWLVMKGITVDEMKS